MARLSLILLAACLMPKAAIPAALAPQPWWPGLFGACTATDLAELGACPNHTTLKELECPNANLAARKGAAKK